MRLSPRQINAFRAVMLTGGMTSASEILGLTQPAISRLIRDLEDRIGLVLFERRGNQLVPTPDAVALVAEVERSFVGLERIAELARALKSQSAGSLRVAALPALTAGALPRFVSTFLRNRPQVQSLVMGMPSHLVIEAVAAGQVDFGYVAGPFERSGFHVEPESAPAVAIVPAGHPLASKRYIDPQDFAGERFVGLAQGTLLRACIDAALAGVPRSTMIETPLSQIACLLVADGAGVSIVDPYAATEYVGRGLAMKPLTIRIEAGFVCIRPMQRPTSPLTTTFMAEFSVYMKRLIQEATT